MAGTLTISTLSDGTNSTSSTNCIMGSAKAYVNFVGSTGAINKSYNVSSVTRSAAGQYLITFTNAMASVNYVSALNAWDVNSVIGSKGIFQGTGQTTTTFNVAYYQAGYTDPLNYQAIVFGG
jgi:trimethylamine:corrinoid methyltransferase-like protein